ncbi:MAG: hypothetical protein AM326_03020 [Candidatus Thorarchaeota archaeon SMTZ-45]|nr:MAG: hypothetical protein AM326_03020 [Candidatus Thorarchaeota archaeon SMTZ-45]
MPAVPRIRINVRDVVHYVGVVERYWEGQEMEIMNHLKDEGLIILREEVPKRSGKLAASCWSEISGKTVHIGTGEPYADIIDGYGRSPPSEGRYVPALGKRLVKVSKTNPRIGIHPGSKKTPFSERTSERVFMIAEERMENALRNMP